jgi:hypothetical protein
MNEFELNALEAVFVFRGALTTPVYVVMELGGAEQGGR